MNSDDCSLLPGMKPTTAGLPVLWPVSDEVSGHMQGGTVMGMRCWNCGESIRFTPPARPDVFYVCGHCLTLNQASPTARSGLGSQGDRRKSLLLSTVFLRGPKEELYEVPQSEAGRFRVGVERLQEIGHAPYPPAADDEVMGHHKIPGASAADASSWTYHTVWEYGCYYDEVAGQFAIGMHRHPYGDERAVAALESDFS